LVLENLDLDSVSHTPFKREAQMSEIAAIV